MNSPTAVNALTMSNTLDLTGSVRTIQVDANTATISGNVTSTGSGAVLTKTGAGTLSLTGPANGTNYNVAVNAGTLTYGATNTTVNGLSIATATLGVTGDVNTKSITSLTDYSLGNGTINIYPVLKGSVGLTMTTTTASTAYLYSDATYSGTTTVNSSVGGALCLGNNSANGSVAGPIVINTGAILYTYHNAAMTMNNHITGTGIFYDWANTVTVNDISSFAGEIRMSSGNTATINLGAQNLPSIWRVQMTGNNLQTTTLSGTGTITASAPYDMVPASGGIAVVNVHLAGTNVPLDMRGAGTTKLMISNSYTGSTTVWAGILQADDNVGLPAASNLVFVGGILQSNGTMSSFTRDFGTGPNQFQFTNGGWSATGIPLTVNIGGLVTPKTVGFGGDVTKNLVQFTLVLSSASATSTTTFANQLDLGNVNRTISVADNTGSIADWAVISGNISGNAALTKAGTGLLKYTGTNTYGGTQGTTINAGVLQADEGSGLPSSAMLYIQGGQLQNTAAYAFTRNLTTVVGPNNFSFGTVGGANSGFSAGDNPFTINIGSGTPVVWTSTTTGANAYLMNILLLNSIFSKSQLFWQNDIDLNAANRIIQVTDSTHNPVTGGFSDADYATVSGVISNSSGTAALSKNGTGLLILTATNTYNGISVINGGVLQADDGVGLPNLGTLYLQGGILQSNSAITFNRAIGTANNQMTWTNAGGFSAGAGKMTVNLSPGGVAGATVVWGSATGINGAYTLYLNSIQAKAETEWLNPIDLNNAARTIQVDDNPNTAADFATISGLIQSATPASGSLTKSGTGKLVLTQTETYTGTTTISGGTLQLGTGGTTGMVAGNIVDSSAGMTGSFGLIVNRSDSFTYTGVISGAGTFKKTGGSGTVMTLTGNCTISGLTTLDIGNGLQFGNGGNSGGYTTGAILNNGTLAANRTDLMAAQSGIISGTGTVTQLGTGTWVLTGANTYSGDTTISAGYLQANSGTGLSNNSFLKIDGGVLQANGAAAVSFTRALAASGAGKFDWTANGGGFSASNTAGGAMNVNVGGALAQLLWGAAPDVGSKIVGTLKLSSATAVDVTTMLNAIDLNGASRTIDVANNTGVTTDKAVMAGVISNGTSTAGLVKTGLGRLDLSAINTYNGATTISTGTLALATNGQIATSSSILNNATFMVVDGTHTVNAISGTGTTMVLGTSSLTAPSISQGTLTIGGTDPGGAAAAVPEPSMLVLLVLAGLGFVGMCLRRK